MKKTPLLLLTLIFSLLIVPTTYAASGENVVAEDMMAVTKYRTVEFVVSEPYTATRTVSYVVKEPYVVTEQVKVTRYRDVVRMAEEEYEAYRTVMVPQQYTAYREEEVEEEYEAYRTVMVPQQYTAYREEEVEEEYEAYRTVMVPQQYTAYREEEVEEEYTAYRDVAVQEKYTAYRTITIKEPYTQKFFDTTVTSYRYVTKKVPYTAYRTVTKKQPYTATRTVTKRVPYTATRMVAETRQYTATRTVTKRVPYTATRMVAETRQYTATRTVRKVFKEPYAVMESIEVTKHREVTKTRTEEYTAYRDVKKTKKEPYVVYEPKLSSIEDSKVDIEEQEEKEVKDREKEVAAVADKKALQAMTEETVEALAKTVAELRAQTQTQMKLTEGKAQQKVDIKKNDESGDVDGNDILFTYTAEDVWQENEVVYRLEPEIGGATLTNRMIISNPTLTQPTTVSVPDNDNELPGSGTRDVASVSFPDSPCAPGVLDVGGTGCICNEDGSFWTCPRTTSDKSAKALENIENLLNEAGATNLGIENNADIKATSSDANLQTKQLSKAVVAQIKEKVASDWQKASEDVAKMTKTERKEMLILLRENNNGSSFAENGLSRKKAKPDEWKTTDENTEEFDWHDGYEAAIDEEIANGIDAISQAASSAQTLDDKIAAIKAAYDIVMKEIQAIATAKWEPVYDDYQNSPIIAAAEELYNQQTESQQLILELAIIEADTIYQEAIAPFEELKLIQGSQSTPTQEWQEAVSEFSEEWRAAINAATEIYIVTTVVARTLYEQTIQPVEDEYDSAVDEIFTERRNRELAALDAKNDATHAAIDASLASAEEN
jgi:hypothetical protein